MFECLLVDFFTWEKVETLLESIEDIWLGSSLGSYVYLKFAFKLVL